jgi:hypothetical protein
VEIPIWLKADDIDALEVEYGIDLLPSNGTSRLLTGHIDFLQVRDGAFHILDYKPAARTEARPGIVSRRWRRGMSAPLCPQSA